MYLGKHMYKWCLLVVQGGVGGVGGVWKGFLYVYHSSDEIIQVHANHLVYNSHIYTLYTPTTSPIPHYTPTSPLHSLHFHYIPHTPLHPYIPTTPLHPHYTPYTPTTLPTSPLISLHPHYTPYIPTISPITHYTHTTPYTSPLHSHIVCIALGILSVGCYINIVKSNFDISDLS